VTFLCNFYFYYFYVGCTRYLYVFHNSHLLYIHASICLLSVIAKTPIIVVMDRIPCWARVPIVELTLGPALAYRQLGPSPKASKWKKAPNIIKKKNI
jgi:hypothetical protein